MVDVKWVSDGAMAVVLVFEDNVLMVISGYAPQSAMKTVFL